MRNAITLFQACLKKFEGSVSFHNFHRLSGRELRDTNSAYKRKMAISNPNAKTDWTSLTALKLSPQQGCDFEDEHEGAYAQSEWDDEESTAAAESDIDSEHHRNSAGDNSRSSPITGYEHYWKESIYENWTEEPRPIVSRSRGVVFHSKAAVHEGRREDGSTFHFLRVKIRGQAFLLQ